MEQVGLCARRVRASSLRHTPLWDFVAGMAAPLPPELFEVAVATLDGRDVSVAFGRQGWVQGIFTLPDFRNRGAGYAALTCLVQNWPEAACESGSPAGERLVARAGVRDLTLERDRHGAVNPRRRSLALAG